MDCVPTKDIVFKKRAPLMPEKPSKRKVFAGFNPVAPAKRDVNPDSYVKLVSHYSQMFLALMYQQDIVSLVSAS